jgi:hypothetical protein
VPLWHRENHCYSCHNNGDAARALYEAARIGRPVPPEALDDTTRWLVRPEDWDHNGGEGPFSNKRLARLQFASALVAAVEARRTDDRRALVRAAERVAKDQEPEGSWPQDVGGLAGAPATYGRPLATWMARDVLRAADPETFRAAIDRADRWLATLRPESIPDAAAVVLATTDRDQSPARRTALDLIRRGQGPDGGWGPFVDAPPEPFDTALAVLALRRSAPTPEARAMARRGRDFLIANQQTDGSWIETTRPAGNQSYAQRLSTAGWATLALLATLP